MTRTYAQILDAIEQKLQDTSNATWGTAELDQYMTAGLAEISQYVPYKDKATVTFASDTKELDISGVSNLIRIRELEYKVDQDPRQLRGFEWIDSETIRVAVEGTPASGESAYVYYDKLHALSGTVSNTLVTHGLEDDYIDLVTARALIDKAPKHYNVVNVGSAKALENLLVTGQRELVDVLFRLRCKRKPHTTRWYPTK